MKKNFRSYNQGPLLLLPSSIKEWMPENQQARFFNDTVDKMELSAILSLYEREFRGYPSYHPAIW